MAYETLLTEVDDAVAIITLNRPEQMNAFNNQLMDDLTSALDMFEADHAISAASSLRARRRAFAAGR